MKSRAMVPQNAIKNEVHLDLVSSVEGARSKRIYESDARVFSEWLHDQEIPLSELTPSHLLQYKEYLLKTYARATAARMFSIARRLLDQAVIHRLLASNPAKDIKGISVENESPHIALTKQQARALLDAIPRKTAKDYRDYALLLLLLRTGIRRTECASLTLGDIQMKGGHHVAIVQHGKGDKRRTIKLPVDVFNAIEAYIQATQRSANPHAPIFCGFLKSGKPTEKGLTDKRIEQIVKEYGTIIGVSLTPHDLRASFITLAMEGGASLTQTQYAAGHADPRTTERYQKRKTNLDTNAVDFIHL